MFLSDAISSRRSRKLLCSIIELTFFLFIILNILVISHFHLNITIIALFVDFVVHISCVFNVEVYPQRYDHMLHNGGEGVE